MKYLQLNNYNFRHLILGISALCVMLLTLLVALISAQIAFQEMSKNLYQQGLQLGKNLAEDSIAPLLYDSAASAEDMVDTLINMQTITEVSIIRSNDRALIQHKEAAHVFHIYPSVTEAEPVKMLETTDGWYFSVLVLSKQSGGNLSGSLLELEEDSITSVLGYINIGISKASIYSSRKNIFIRNFMISVFASALLLLLMYLVLRNITRPLEQLSALMEQGRQGEYPETMVIHGTKEITDMSSIFNTMITAIKEREQYLSLTLDSIGDAVIATDENGYVVRMNPVAEKLTGWSFEQAKGQSVKDVFPIINATTREPIKNPVEKVLESGEIVYLSNHTTLIAKDKKEYQIADSAAPIRNPEGDILGMVLVFNDVTEQYKLRQDASKNKRDLQAVMDNSPAVIYVKDVEGHYLFINRRFESLFHIERDDMIGKTDADIFSTDFADEFRQNDIEVLEAGHAIESEESVPQDDGIHVYMSVKFPLLNENDEVYAICGISTDITERQKQEEQLRRSQKMDALGKLTGGVAHDYNNMLGVVMGYADLLETQLDDNPKLKKYTQKIIHAGERGSQLTKKLLAFSKQKKNDAELVNINSLLHDEQDMLQKVITARITLVLELDENLWPVYLDSGDLEDAIVNLSINAMHAIEGNGKLTIRTCNHQLGSANAKILRLDERDYIRLSITDTGCGMDQSTKDKIFEPFYTTKGEKGTGLGLAQVYGFVDRSNGAIQVYSEAGHGTEFVLYFPAKYKNQSREIIEDVKLVTDYKGNETILVVDDEPALLELTCEILNQQGYLTVYADDAKRALEILEEESVDLMLSDVIMPDIDGYQLAGMVQEKYPDVKIQLASGFSDHRHSDLVDESLQANLIAKPYQAIILLKRIRELLDS